MKKLVDWGISFLGGAIACAWTLAIIALPVAITVACINWIINIIGG